MIGAAGLVLGPTGLTAQESGNDTMSLPSRYVVELIIFRHLDQSRNTPEIPAAASMIEASPFELNLAELPGETGAEAEFQERTWATAAESTPSDAPLGRRPARKSGPMVGFVLLPLTLEFPDFLPSDKAEFQLTRVYSRIDRLDAYEPLLHLGWIQPARGTDEAKSYLIGNPPEGESVGVSGTITLYKERYIHLALDLALDSAPAGDSFTPIAEPPPERVFGTETFVEPQDVDRRNNETHKLQQSRRIRLSTTHYFDHPLFGVIATVNEIETVTDPDAADAS